MLRLHRIIFYRSFLPIPGEKKPAQSAHHPRQSNSLRRDAACCVSTDHFLPIVSADSCRRKAGARRAGEDAGSRSV